MTGEPIERFFIYKAETRASKTSRSQDDSALLIVPPNAA
jgi:hypothetical protein